MPVFHLLKYFLKQQQSSCQATVGWNHWFVQNQFSIRTLILLKVLLCKVLGGGRSVLTAPYVFAHSTLALLAVLESHEEMVSSLEHVIDVLQDSVDGMTSVTGKERLWTRSDTLRSETSNHEPSCPRHVCVPSSPSSQAFANEDGQPPPLPPKKKTSMCRLLLLKTVP